MRVYNKKKLGDLLIEVGIINNEQLKQALIEQKKSGKKLGESLIDLGYVTKIQLREILEFQLGIPYVDLDFYNIDMKLSSIIPETMVRKYDVIPLEKKQNTLILSCADPLNAVAIDDVRIYTGLEIQPVMSDEKQIREFINKMYNRRKAEEVVEAFERQNEISIKNAPVKASENDLLNEVNESPAVKLINLLFEQAYENKASDIHIEPQKDYVRIRFRIDGQLRDIMRPSIEMQPALVSRVKVLANLNIAEKRLPQDGRTTITLREKDLDLRISIIPTILGEKVVIRLISKESFEFKKSELGFTSHNLKLYEEILRSPYGIILLTGPTGSGKTTTLYTSIKEIRNPGINIITVEDPVESTIEDIAQIQVNPKAGLTFATALRSILRQDPDVIFIGEIRDNETAEIAVRSAITGHLVLSTLHTNDAPSSVIRLIDMGIEPFLVSTALKGVIAQRLVRKICKYCKESYVADYNQCSVLEVPEGTKLYRGKGCPFCKGTGYSGRTAVHEVMKIDGELRKAIYNGDNSDVLRDIAIKNGMVTLKENCKELLLQGISTYDELLKTVYLQE